MFNENIPPGFAPVLAVLVELPNREDIVNQCYSQRRYARLEQIGDAIRAVTGTY